jgi:hypothetical protein
MAITGTGTAIDPIPNLDSIEDAVKWIIGVRHQQVWSA